MIIIPNVNKENSCLDCPIWSLCWDNKPTEDICKDRCPIAGAGSVLDDTFRMASEIRYAVGISTLKECYEATKNGSIRRVKHGTWGENIYGYRKCSVCGRATQVDECMREPLYLYCPYCGADLRGERNE